MKRAEIEQIIAERYGVNAQYILPEIDGDLRYIDRVETKWVPLFEGDSKEKNLEYAINDALENAERVNKNKLTPATAKVGDGATICLWSDRHAGTIIKVTKSTITVQRDKATLDPNWKPEWVAGGFAGHCTNQDDQTYTYERDLKGEVETFRWSTKYNQYGQPGNLRAIKGRHEFYDYNF